MASGLTQWSLAAGTDQSPARPHSVRSGPAGTQPGLQSSRQRLPGRTVAVLQRTRPWAGSAGRAHPAAPTVSCTCTTLVRYLVLLFGLTSVIRFARLRMSIALISLAFTSRASFSVPSPLKVPSKEVKSEGKRSASSVSPVKNMELEKNVNEC